MHSHSEATHDARGDRGQPVLCSQCSAGCAWGSRLISVPPGQFDLQNVLLTCQSHHPIIATKAGPTSDQKKRVVQKKLELGTHCQLLQTT